MEHKIDESRCFPVITDSGIIPDTDLAAMSLDVDTPADLAWFDRTPAPAYGDAGRPS